MTHYYYFIKDWNEKEMIIYNVKVGNQLRHDKILSKLTAMCTTHRYYLNIRNSISTEFVRNLMSNYCVTIRTISVVDAYKLCQPNSVRKSKANNYAPINFV